MAGSVWKRIFTFKKCKCLFISPGIMEMPANHVIIKCGKIAELNPTTNKPI